jgi:hypothetical protein
MKKQVVFLMALVMMVLAVQATAAIFSDGFEDVPHLSLPDGNGKWDSSEATNYPNPIDVVVEDGLGPDGSKALVVKRVDSEWRVGMTKALFAPVTSGIVEVSASYTEGGPNKDIGLFMFNWDGPSGPPMVMESMTSNYGTGGSTAVLQYNVPGLTSDHTPFEAVGGGYLEYIGGDGDRIYNHVKYTIDLDNDTMVAELNGVVSVPIAVDFGTAGLTDLWVKGLGDGQAMIVDNVLIVPEPATMCLLAVGGLLLRRRKA